jgi:hypothetical protein
VYESLGTLSVGLLKKREMHSWVLARGIKAIGALEQGKVMSTIAHAPAEISHWRSIVRMQLRPAHSDHCGTWIYYYLRLLLTEQAGRLMTRQLTR